MFIVSALLSTLLQAISIIKWVLIAYLILGWLNYFNITSPTNRFINGVYDILQRVFEPLFHRIRRFLPNFGTIDLAPLVFMLIIFFIESLIIGFYNSL